MSPHPIENPCSLSPPKRAVKNPPGAGRRFPSRCCAFAGAVLVCLLFPGSGRAGWVYNTRTDPGTNTNSDGSYQHITEIDTYTDDIAQTLKFVVTLDGTFTAADAGLQSGLLGTIEIDAGGMSGQTFKVAGLTGNFTTDYYISLDSENNNSPASTHSGPNLVDINDAGSNILDTVGITYSSTDPNSSSFNQFSVTVSYADIGESGDVSYAVTVAQDGTLGTSSPNREVPH